METKKLTQLIMENLLLEGRLEDVKNKYPQPMWSIIDRLSNIDPSGNNKYLDWMAKTFLKTTIKWFKDNAGGSGWSAHQLSDVPDTAEDPRWENIYNLRRKMSGISDSDLLTLEDSIEHFHKNPSKYQIKDINQFSGKEDFYNAVEIAKQQLSRKEQKDTGVDKVFEDDTFILMMPKTHKASCRYGSNTKWCVTMRGYSGYFENYFTQGPIFFLIDKRRTPKSYSPSYMEKAPDYWKVAIHYRPFNGRLDNSGKNALNYARKMSKEEFLDGANVGNTKIDYWNVQDDNKKESVVAKYLAGPGRGQTQRSEVILNNFKSVMETYTKKVMGDFYDSVHNSDDSSQLEELNNLREEYNRTRNEKSNVYRKKDRLSSVISNLDSFESRLETDEGDDHYRTWVVEQLKKAREFWQQLDNLYNELDSKEDKISLKISKIEAKLADKGLVFYDKEKNVRLRN